MQISGRSLCKTRLLCTIQYYFTAVSQHCYHTHTHTHIRESFVTDAAHTSQEYYKQWLCSTKLSFYNSSLNSMDSASLSNGSSDGEAGQDGGPDRLRPCLSVCHNVLQSCPYYLPSRFQPNDQSVIYGGYPAFDCPSKLQV